jgi:homoprotocatechuate degradation regulator HpaR
MNQQTALLYGRKYAGSASHRAECRELPVKIIRVREAFMALFRGAFQEVDLTDPQWRVLRVLSTVDEIDTAALAERAILLGPSLTRILRDLDQRGLVTRRNSRLDARRSLHSITPEGLRIIDEIIPRFDPFYQSLARRMDQGDVAQLGALLDMLLENLDAAIKDSEE